jgi:hypothetical protein
VLVNIPTHSQRQVGLLTAEALLHPHSITRGTHIICTGHQQHVTLVLVVWSARPPITVNTCPLRHCIGTSLMTDD